VNGWSYKTRPFEEYDRAAKIDRRALGDPNFDLFGEAA
jgi:hypothetical protein